MNTSGQQNSLSILIGELIADDELCDSFLRDPDQTLRLAGDWALPLSETELQSLRAGSYRVWETVVEQLDLQFHPV